MKLNGNFTIIPNEFINDSRIDVYEFRTPPEKIHLSNTAYISALKQHMRLTRG